MSNIRWLALVAIGMLTGCATQPAKNQTTSANASADDVQCHTVQSTGSMVLNTVCTTKADRDAQQAAQEDWRNAAQRTLGACRGAGAQCGGPGG
jgi:uncharacterized lipoprotein YajG